MSDKEPRRRKKRKDQTKKTDTDDAQFEETSYAPQKPESRDSDQEAEDDHFVATQHQPSTVAKVIFMLLFSTLVVTMSIVFIALRGTERGPVDIFDMDHHEAVGEADGHHDEDMEVWNISEQYADQHDEDTHIIESIETEVPEVPDLEEELISNVYKSEESSEELNIETASEVYDETQFETAHSWLENTDDDIDDDVINDEATTFAPASDEVEEDRGEIVVEKSIPEHFRSVYEDLEEVEEPVLESEPPVSERAVADESLEKYDEDDDSSDLGSDDATDSGMHEEATEPHTSDDRRPPPYEKLDVTNEDDFNIKEELDDIDSILDKDEVDDDDVYEAEEEFDFWHF